jgi:hypothetical protein
VRGLPPPPITETLSNRYRARGAAPSDGNFINGQQESEAFSATFICTLALPTPYTGEALLDLAMCLTHQGVVPFAPVVTRELPYPYMVAFDTNFPLPVQAANRVINFIEREDANQSQPYQHAWARSLPRAGWCILSAKIRRNLQVISGLDV